MVEKKITEAVFQKPLGKESTINGKALQFLASAKVAKEQTIFELPEEAAEEDDDYIFQKGSLTSLTLHLREMRKLPLLKPEEEKNLGEKIFVAKLALRNIKIIFDVLSPQDRSQAEDLLKGKGKYLSDTLESELLYKPKIIEEEGKKGEDSSEDRAFLKDVRNNDEFVQDKLKEFSSIEEDDLKKQAISVFANQQFAFIEKGNEAFDKFTISNLKLVTSIAKRYQGLSLSIEDLIGYGNEGLLVSVAKFDFRKGFKFSTFATWWIKQKITRAIPDYGSTIRVPVHLHERLIKLKRKQNAMLAQGNNISLEELFKAERKGDNNDGIVRAIRTQRILSLDEPMGYEEGLIKLEDLVTDSTNIEEEVISNFGREEIREMMSARLTEKEFRVLCLRFGLDDDKARTLEEVGEEFGLTRERIRQIEAIALRKLRQPGENFARRFKNY